MADNTPYPGQAQLSDAADHFANVAFQIRQMQGKLWTTALVKVIACSNAGVLAAQGFVTVQPLVSMTDASGTVYAHGSIYGVPYFRLQGGSNAVILDPVAGDIGMCAFAMRDISTVKVSRAVSPPASARRNDPADGLYLGGFLNGVPSQYVQFSSAGVTIVSATAINLQAPTVTITGALTVSGESTFEGKAFSTHKHSGVTTGSGDTGAPV